MTTEPTSTTTPKGDSMTTDPFPWEDAFEATPDDSTTPAPEPDPDPTPEDEHAHEWAPLDDPHGIYAGRAFVCSCGATMDDTAVYPFGHAPEQTPEPSPLDDVIEEAVEEIHERTEPAAVEPYAGMSLDPEGILDALSDFAVRSATIGQATRAIEHAVRTRADVRRQARVDKLGGEEVKHTTDVRREAVGAANDADVLDALAGAFTTGAKEARGIAGDLLDELPGRGGKPRASLKVADGDGFELSITRSKRSELSVAFDELVDVISIHVLARAAAEHDAKKAAGVEDQSPLALSTHPTKVYASGVRAGIAALREVLASSPTFRSTALDSLARQLEDADDDDLAKRLRAAYGKVDKGEPSIKIDRKPIPTPKPAAAASTTEEAGA